ncbi:MAG: SpoIIE family protein phosphatase [Candidatus Krumholzibacteriia bacterium]
MSLNREYLRQAGRSSLMGTGAARWLSPRARRWFLLGTVGYSAAAGLVLGLLPVAWSGAGFAAIAVALMIVPFVAYDIMVSYLLLERRDREGEMAVAARIQAGLLPTALPEHPRWECAGRYRPARRVGGDYWEVLVLPDGRWLLVVADVSGKGVPAAILMAGLRTRLHLLAEQEPDPVRMATRLNEAMAAETQPTEFATALLVLLDPATSDLTYVNAGHPPGLLLHADGTTTTLKARGIPLGMLSGSAYAAGTAAWQPGDRLLLYSDGVLDAAVDRQGPLAPEELAAALGSVASAEAGVLADAVLAMVGAVAGDAGPEDDISILACCFR